MSKSKTPLYKVIIYDIAGITCLLLVPILGPLPGPGGIPLTIAGLGFLAINHKWARDMLQYVEKHSESLQKVLFPDTTWVKWAWDILVVILVMTGTLMQIYGEGWLVSIVSLGLFAGSTTIYMLNRQRLEWLDSKIRKNRNKQK